MWVLSCPVYILAAVTVAVAASASDHRPTVVQSTNDAEPQEGRIFGGSDAELGMFPHQVALFDYTGRFYCGGSIISEDWVMTAGHCILGSYARGTIEVRVGMVKRDLDPFPEDQKFATSQKDRILHPQYNPTYKDDDIALIRMPRKIVFNANTRPVTLPTYSDVTSSFVGETIVVSGYGRTNDTSSLTSPTLKWTEMKVSRPNECVFHSEDILTPTKICVATSGHSSCFGDSGGPVSIRRNGTQVQIGIVSFGSSRGCTVGRPVGFTRVTSCLDFIEDITGIEIQD